MYFHFINTSYYVFSLLIVEKSSFESNFGLIQQPNKLAPDYSYSLLILSILMAACLRQIEMSHAKEGELLRTQFDNGWVNNASTSFFTLFHSLEFIFTTYFASNYFIFTSYMKYLCLWSISIVTVLRIPWIIICKKITLRRDEMFTWLPGQ